MSRMLTERVLDRLWREAGQRLGKDLHCADLAHEEDGRESISGNMPWARVCASYAHGSIESRQFRRLKAVRSVVETVGITEARHYAARIREWAAGWLDHPQVRAIDDWGDPIRCPAILLGTSRAFSPTTLRYLATALWLKRSGKLPPNSEILEIGVGFGGLAAMNALVSGSTTVLVDLPQVEQAAVRMMHELGMGEHVVRSTSLGNTDTVQLLVSNYAFSELSSSLQDDYLRDHLTRARHGAMVSNAAVFSDRIGGRTDEEIVRWLNEGGIPALMEDAETQELLTQVDTLCGVHLIHW